MVSECRPLLNLTVVELDGGCVDVTTTAYADHRAVESGLSGGGTTTSPPELGEYTDLCLTPCLICLHTLWCDWTKFHSERTVE